MTTVRARSACAILSIALLSACGGDDDGAGRDGSTDAPSGIDARSGTDAPQDTGPCVDADGDGYASAACGGDDCNDGDAEVHPGAAEICDAGARDEDCDTATAGRDADGDGHDDTACCNRDGSGGMICGDDCDDADVAIHGGATEVCDAGGVDEDCDPTTFGPDGDGDGVEGAACCNGEPGALDCGTDCDDANATAHPGGTEVCDAAGADEDCDPATLGTDEDGDGHALPGCCNRDAEGVLQCGGDCVDTNADVYPMQAAWFTTDRGDGSFDYDCNDMDDQRWPRNGACVVLSAACSVFTEGWSSSAGGVPPCGGSGQWLDRCESGPGCIRVSRMQECH